MKRSLLRFLTSVYIMIVSVVLIVISAYAWFTISDAPMTQAVPMGVAGRDAIGLPDKDYSIWAGYWYEQGSSGFDAIRQEENGTYIITNATEFVSVLKLAENPEVSSISMRLEADISLADMPWNPILPNSDGTPKVITIHGNGKELVCTSAPLFSGNQAGAFGIVVNDLTIAHSKIGSTDVGAGAFVGNVTGMELVVLENCHLYASDVTGQNAGGLIGWTAGYSYSQPPIQTNVQVIGCTVDSCQVTAVQTVGGIIGYAGGDPATNHLIQDCSVTNTVLRSNNPDSYMGIGTILGTAGTGSVYVTECTASDITEIAAPGLDHENTSFLVYGREDYGSTGKLVITENGEVTMLGNRDMTFYVGTPAELAYALQYAADPAFMHDVTINIIDDIDMSGYGWTPVRLATEDSESALTINGHGCTLYGLTAPLLGGTLDQCGLETLEIRNLTIANSNIVSTNTVGNGAFIECVNGLISVTMDNCHLLSSTITGDTREGTRTGGLIGWTYAARTATGTAQNTSITVTNCSVTGSTLTSYGTVGGLIGHVGAHPKADHWISGCSVTDTKLNSIEPEDGYKGVGTMVGTINQGSATIVDCVSSGNTEYSLEPVPEIYNEDGLEYGRLALSTVGRACIINENGTMNFGSGFATFDVSTEAGLRKAMEYVSCGDYSGNITINLNNHLTLENKWTPVLLATAESSDIITISGNGCSITGLTAPLLAGGICSQQGLEKLVIRDLTIANSTIESTNTLGNGALIECVAGMQSVTLDNCHLISSTITSDIVEGIGGLIGWTSAGIDTAGERVPTTICVASCTVDSSTIVGYGTVGGIIGHAGYNDCVTHQISYCSVSGNTLESTESPYKGVGPILGTANIGKVYINNCSVNNNEERVPTGCEEDNSKELLYGRFVPGDTGLLYIDDIEILVPVVTPVVVAPTQGETTGVTDTTGATGTTGATDTTGATGTTGATDTTGATGTTGATDTPGTTGTTGATDTPGATGTGETTIDGNVPVSDDPTAGNETDGNTTSGATDNKTDGENVTENTENVTDGENVTGNTENVTDGENVTENTENVTDGENVTESENTDNEQNQENTTSTEETPKEESSEVEAGEINVETTPVA